MNPVINKKTSIIRLGLIDYKAAWDFQTTLFDQVVEKKVANRDKPADKQQRTENYLIFCEHPHVYTIGKSGKDEHLLLDEKGLLEKQATFYKINRGGDITYHGPGQIVGYPILDLDNFFTDIHKYLRLIEEAVIRTLEKYNIKAGRIDGLTGVWVGAENEGTARKICAIGVKSSRWVTMHGFAFNVNSNLDYFNNIIPCGIPDKAVTSMQAELGVEVNMGEVQDVLLKEIAALFEMELQEGDY